MAAATIERPSPHTVIEAARYLARSTVRDLQGDPSLHGFGLRRQGIVQEWRDLLRASDLSDLPGPEEINQFLDSKSGLGETAPYSGRQPASFDLGSNARRFYVVSREFVNGFIAGFALQHELEHFYGFQLQGVSARFLVLLYRLNTGRMVPSWAVEPIWPEGVSEEDKQRAILVAAEAVQQKGSHDKKQLQSSLGESGT